MCSLLLLIEKTTFESVVDYIEAKDAESGPSYMCSLLLLIEKTTFESIVDFIYRG